MCSLGLGIPAPRLFQGTELWTHAKISSSNLTPQNSFYFSPFDICHSFKQGLKFELLTATTLGCLSWKISYGKYLMIYDKCAYDTVVSNSTCIQFCQWDVEKSVTLCSINPLKSYRIQFSSVQLLSHIRLFATPWTAAHQTSLSITNSGAYSNSWPSSRWCHPTISSSVAPFSSYLQSFPASGSFQMSQFFT